MHIYIYETFRIAVTICMEQNWYLHALLNSKQVKRKSYFQIVSNRASHAILVAWITTNFAEHSFLLWTCCMRVQSEQKHFF